MVSALCFEENHWPLIIFHFSFVILSSRRSSMTNGKWKMIYDQ